MKSRTYNTLSLIFITYLISQCSKEAVEIIAITPGCYPSKTIGNGDTTSYAYNKLGQLISLNVRSNGPKSEPLNFTYNDAGYQSGIYYSKAKQRLIYDELNRLTSIYSQYPSNGDLQTLTYNNAGQLSIMFHVYQYDFQYNNESDKNPTRVITPYYVLEYEYDDKKTPFSNLPKVYSFSPYNDIIFRPENNITKITARKTNSDLISINTFEYDYNDQGFPTKVTTTTTRPKFPTAKSVTYYLYYCY